MTAHSSSRRWRTVFIVVLLAGSVAWGCEPERAAGPVPPIGQRSSFDRPDEIVGAQIHLIYAVCEDCEDWGLDRGLEPDDLIEELVSRAQAWFERESGGATLRLDTFGGRLDITYVPIPGRDADLRELGSGLVNVLAEQAVRRGLDDRSKTYLIFYDGDNVRTCGSAQFGLGYSAQYLQAVASRGCSISDRSVLHEAFHAMGFVDPGAPNHDPLRPGHVTGTRDLMSGAVLGPELDPGSNDYYGPRVPDDVANLLGSPFVDEPDVDGGGGD